MPTSQQSNVGRDGLSPRDSHKKAVWLSYDLGLRGDYTGLYAWLDTHGARECGDATAFFETDTPQDVSDWLRQELTQHVKLAPNDRLYAIYHDGPKMKGKFINGGRKRAPWEGYGHYQGAEDTEDVA